MKWARFSAIQILLFGIFLVLMPSGVFSSEWEAVIPQNQPSQKKSKITYNSKLKDPFFETEQWSYPWWIIKHEDGHIENTIGGSTNEKEIPRWKHTADCSSSQQYDHEIKFANAQLQEDGTVLLYINDVSASTVDNLLIKIKNGSFNSQYWTTYPDSDGNTGLIWTTKKQKLVLDKRVYQRGDIIKGKIVFECFEQLTDPQYRNEPGKKIKIKGVFKTTLQ